MYNVFVCAFGLVTFLFATILFYVIIVPEKRRPYLNRFGKFLHDLCNFKVFILEKILKFMYIFTTISSFLGGFVMLFWFEERYYQTEYIREWVGYRGLVLMLAGPIAIRIVYEILMMGLIAIKNIIEINSKLKKPNEESNESNSFKPVLDISCRDELKTDQE